MYCLDVVIYLEVAVRDFAFSDDTPNSRIFLDYILNKMQFTLELLSPSLFPSISIVSSSPIPFDHTS